MKSALCLLFLTLASVSVAQAATYECTDRQGRRTYTNTSVSGQNCRAIDLGRPSIYSSVAPTVSHTNTSTPAADAAPVAPEKATEPTSVASSEAIATAESRLQQARQNLEQGRQVRYGNERNYARYLERIKGLENEVANAQQQLNNLKQGQ